MRRLSLLLAALASSSALAHPVPKDGRGRTVIVRPTPAALVVEYRLEIGPVRALEDMDADTRAEMGKSPERFASAYLKVMREHLERNLFASLDGEEVKLTCTAANAAWLDHLRCDFRFEAGWRLDPGKRHALRFVADSYVSGPQGQLHLTLAPSADLTIGDIAAPSDELLSRPPEKLTGPDQKALRHLSATVLATPESLPGMAKPALAPDTAGRPGSLFRVGRSKPLSGTPDVTGRADAPPDVSAKAEGWSLLHLLFDTKRGVALLLVLAALFGAAHALTPGHGKTMVAAYLIGERGTVWHALVLGLVTTLTHTSSVMALAVLLLFFPATDRQAMQAALGLVGGLLIAGTGLWLLMQRLAGRADHVHLDDGTPPPTDGGKPGWWQLILLGISGGLVPCWDAIILLGMAVTAQKLWLGLPLLLAFSAGLAAVLVAVGIAVVKARGLIVRAREAQADGTGEVSLGRWDATLERLGRVLPLVSAVAIIAIGLWMCFASAGGAGH